MEENRYMKTLDGDMGGVEVSRQETKPSPESYMKPIGGVQETVQTETDGKKPERKGFIGRVFRKPSVKKEPVCEGSPVTGMQETLQAVTEEKPVVSKTEPTKHYAFEIVGLNHTFDVGTENEFRIFDNFSMRVEDKPGKSEVVTIMGGSGCGKSCILRMAAGLMTPQSGEIRILGRHIDEYKSVPMVFQSYSSFEWMTVLDNVALPMVIKGVEKAKAREIAADTLKLVGLDEHATKYAKSSVLSGGQLQRVSIARCLTSDSPVFFLDEATGALDIKMKREIQDLIIKIAHETEHTIVNVTHSIEEALYISDKIFILKPNPCTIYREMDISYGNDRRGKWVLETDTYREYESELNAVLDEVCK